MYGYANTRKTFVKFCWLLLATSLVILLHGCGSRSQPAPVSSVYKGKTIHDYERASLTSSSYQVGEGETLYSIAFRANVDVRSLAQLNNLSAPYTIYPGQTLQLKRSSARSTQRVESKPKSPQRTTNNQQSKPIADISQKEYLENKNTTKQVVRVPVPSTPEPRVANADITWQWPSEAPVIAEFSLQQAGNKGIDFGGERGAPVLAAAAGKVVYVGNALRGFGRLIILKHNDDFITAYAHNDALLVKEQQFVRAGEEIARMGSSDADRVKLHFEVRFRGKSVNPRNYLPK